VDIVLEFIVKKQGLRRYIDTQQNSASINI